MTIQEVLKNCDKEEVANNFIYKYGFTNSLLNKDYDKVTFGEYKTNIKKHVYDLIDKLINLKANDSNSLLMVVHSTGDDDISTELFDKDEIREKKDFYTTYGYEFCKFEDTLGYEVADNYLTQYYLIDLITDYLYEMSWTGWNQEYLEDNINKLKESEKEYEEYKDDPKHFKSWDDFKKEIEENHGFEFEKYDPEQWDAYMKYIKQQGEYCNKCIEIEVSKWRDKCLKK